MALDGVMKSLGFGGGCNPHVVWIAYEEYVKGRGRNCSLCWAHLLCVHIVVFWVSTDAIAVF